MEGAEVAHLQLPGLALKYFTRTEGLSPHNRDIVPGVYEGGFKLWECTSDLLRFLVDHPQLVAGKRVLEMGCGHGLAAVLAAKLGATSLGLQDFNPEVLTQLTRRTL
jgi:cyclopropane fatty-acyl-phospholipid synthase-like methyltransferase